MPPDEDLDLEPTEPTEPAEPASPEPTDPAPAGPNLAAQVQQLVAEGNQPILQAIQQLGQVLVQQQQAQNPGEPAPEPSELAEKLLTDPKSVITEEITETLRNQLAGPLARSFEVDRDERVEARAAEIDLEWGDGFFDERIRDRLIGEQGNLRAWPINQQADPRVIDSAINAILGNDFRDSETREEMKQALDKAAKARAEREVAMAPHMMGPGRPSYARTDKLTPDHKSLLEGFNKAGIEMTEKDIKEALTRENTLDAWQPKAGADQ